MLSVSPVGLLCLLPIALYLKSIFAVAARLKSAYPQTWDELGRPSPLNLSVTNSLLVTRYLFATRHVTGADPTLSRWIWAARALLLISLAMLASGMLTPRLTWPV